MANPSTTVAPALFDLIVFDLDGTLIDSRLDLANSVNEMLGSFGADSLASDRVTAMIGDGARTLVRRALLAAGIPPSGGLDLALERFLTIYERRMLEHTRCYAGIEAALESLASRVPLAVLTNKPLKPTERILEQLGLRVHFQAVCGGDGPRPRKPEPDGLLELARRFSVEPVRTLMVGDSMVDLRTAMNARTRCCVVTYGFGFPGHEAIAAQPDVLVADTPRALVELCAG